MKINFYRLLVLFNCLLFSIAVSAQSFSVPTNLKDLKHQYLQAADVNDEFESLRKLSNYYVGRNNIDSAIYYNNEIYDLGVKRQNSLLLCTALTRIGECYSKQRQFDLANKKFNECLRIAKSKSSEFLKYHTYSAKAKNFGKIEQLDSAVFYFFLALDDIEINAEKSDVHGLNASTFINLAFIYEDAYIFDEAEKFYLLAEESFEKLGDTIGLIMHYSMMTDFYINSKVSSYLYGRYKQKLIRLELEIGQKYDFSHLQLESFNKLSIEEQIDFVEQALKINMESSQYEMIKVCFNKLVELHKKRENWSEALEVIENALNYSSGNNLLIYQDRISLDKEFLYLKYDILKSQSKYQSALKILESINDLEDSISMKSNIQLLHELNVKYESAKKQEELTKSRLEIEQRTNQRNLFVSLGVFFLLGAYFNWKRYQQRKLLAYKSQKLLKQEISVLENEKKILSMNSMIKGQERERERISRDLHDGIGGLLSSIKTHFSLIKDEIKITDKKLVYQQTEKMLDQAVVDIRRISQNLIPNSLRLSGLTSAISQLLQEIENIHGIDCNLELIGPFSSNFNEDIDIFLYRIIQEACNNVIKHSKANSLFVQLSKFEEEIILFIEDDGIGFDSQIEYEGMGLDSIYSRVNHLSGTTDLDTRIGRGTAITINIPT